MASDQRNDRTRYITEIECFSSSRQKDETDRITYMKHNGVIVALVRASLHGS